MQACIVIHGISAVGKTTITGRLLKLFGRKQPTALIQGDFFAHMIYGCTYTDEQIDIKYINMSTAIDLFLSRGYSVLIDDFFKRSQDIEKIVNITRKCNIPLFAFHLNAELDVLLLRNRIRDYWDRIEEKKTALYSEVFHNLHFMDEIIIDSSTQTSDETTNIIIKALVSKGFYQPNACNIISEFFRPIEDNHS
jgi:predicted kinase